MSKTTEETLTPKPDALFGRVVTILEQAQGNVVRAVNTNMVLAYWFIGHEIVEELQSGEERAEYGKKVVEDLSARLTERYGKGFSEENLQLFRRFYRVYCDRVAISYPPGTKFGEAQKSYPAGTKSGMAQILCPTGGELAPSIKSYPAGTESPQGFSPQLSWSHYSYPLRFNV